MILAVASGKGGTGKTTVATNLARVFSVTDQVQIADLDVEAPNVHLFLRPTIKGQTPAVLPVPQIDPERCTLCGRCAEICAFNALLVATDRVLVFQEICHGCGGCRWLCPEQAITEADRVIGDIRWGCAGDLDFLEGSMHPGGALAPPVTRQTRKHLKLSGMVIIDAPPGNTCPTVEAIRGTNACLLVTEPTPFGLRDLQLAVTMVNKLRIPSSVMINRADLGDDAVRNFCKASDVPILAEFPFDPVLAHGYASGTLAVDLSSEWEHRFQDLAHAILEWMHAPAFEERMP